MHWSAFLCLRFAFTQTLCCTHLFLTILPISSLPFELKFIYFLQKEWKDGLIISKPATRKYKSCNVQVLITVLYLSAVEPTSFSSLVTETDGDIRIITHLTETAPQNRTRHAAGFFTPLCLQRDSKGREFLQGFHCVFCFLFLLAYKLNYDCCWHNVVYIYMPSCSCIMKLCCLKDVKALPHAFSFSLPYKLQVFVWILSPDFYILTW